MFISEGYTNREVHRESVSLWQRRPRQSIQLIDTYLDLDYYNPNGFVSL